MPDIMIRGISLPEGELKYVTLWVYGDGRVYVSNNASAASSQRLQDLAVPLPEGHGRLIDADELMDRARGCLDELTILSLEFLVNGSSTIVPAEGGEADGN